MKDTFYDMETGRTYVNGEHMVLAKADLKQKRRQEKRLRDFQAQQKAKAFREKHSKEMRS